MSVSIIVPAHNAGGSIAATLSSLSSEATVIREILVVDDASTDNTRAIAARTGVQLRLPVRILAATARDAGQARNIGLDQASAPLIYFFDADDRHCTGGLRRLVAEARRMPDAGLIVAAHQRCRDGSYLPVARRRRCGRNLDENAAQYLTGRIRPIVMGSALVKRAAINDVRFPLNMPYDEDTMFWAAILSRSPMATIDDCVMIYEESTQRARDRLRAQPVADFLRWRRGTRNLAQWGINRRAIAIREGLIAMMIAELHESSGDYNVASRFLTIARAAPANLLQKARRRCHAIKIAMHQSPSLGALAKYL